MDCQITQIAQSVAAIVVSNIKIIRGKAPLPGFRIKLEMADRAPPPPTINAPPRPEADPAR